MVEALRRRVVLKRCWAELWYRAILARLVKGQLVEGCDRLQDFVRVTIAAGIDDLANEALSKLNQLERDANPPFGEGPRAEDLWSGVPLIKRCDVHSKCYGPFHRAVQFECRRYAGNANVPQVEWIHKWFTAGSHAECPETLSCALESLSESLAEPAAVGEVIALLISNGAVAESMSFHFDMDGGKVCSNENIILRALRRPFEDENAQLQWQSIWRDVAMVSFTKLSEGVRSKAKDLEDTAVVALTAGVSESSAQLGKIISDVLSRDSRRKKRKQSFAKRTWVRQQIKNGNLPDGDEIVTGPSRYGICITRSQRSLCEAVLSECQRAWIPRVPRADWLRTWFAAGATAHALHGNFESFEALEILAWAGLGQGLTAGELLESVSILATHGARARGELILIALEHELNEPLAFSQWQDSWRRAAAAQLRWAVNDSRYFTSCSDCKSRVDRLFGNCGCSEFQPFFPQSSLDVQVAAFVAAMHAKVGSAKKELAAMQLASRNSAVVASIVSDSMHVSGFLEVIHRCRQDLVTTWKERSGLDRSFEEQELAIKEKRHTLATTRMRTWLDEGSPLASARSDTEVADLLELFALSNRKVDELVEPVAILVGHGASAPGPSILTALQKAKNPYDLNAPWCSLWRRAAKTKLHQLLVDADFVDRCDEIVAVLAALLVGRDLEPTLLKLLKHVGEDWPDLLARAQVMKGEWMLTRVDQC